MTKNPSRLAVAVLVLVIVSAGAAWAQEARLDSTVPHVLDVQGGKIRVVPVATGLYHPWGLAFPDARTILVAEKNGKLRMIRDGVLAPEPVWTSPTATAENAEA